MMSSHLNYSLALLALTANHKCRLSSNEGHEDTSPSFSMLFLPCSRLLCNGSFVNHLLYLMLVVSALSANHHKCDSALSAHSL